MCSWTHNKQRLSVFRDPRISFTTSELLDWSITVRDASEDDQGQWECTCRSSYPSTYVRHNNTVVTVLSEEAKPQTNIFRLQPKNLTVDIGETFSLDCLLHTRTICQWRRNGIFISRLSNYMSSYQSYFVLSAAKYHEGRWQCVCSSSKTSSNLDIYSNEAWIAVRSPDTTNIGK